MNARSVTSSPSSPPRSAGSSRAAANGSAPGASPAPETEESFLLDAPYRATLSPEAEFVLLGSRITLEGERAARFDHLLGRGQPYPGERRRAAAHNKVAPLSWTLILYLCSKHRVTGLIGKHLSSRGWRHVPPEIVNGMSRYFGAMALHSSTLSEELAHVTRYLEDGGVSVVSFKGPTLAYALYGNGTVRPSSDLDLLVPRDQVQRAHELLRQLGYAHEVELTPAQEKAHMRVDSVFNLLRPSPKELAGLFPQGLAVELHWAITSPCLPFDFTYESVRDGLHPLQVRGPLNGALALSAHDLFLLLAVHGAKHLWERALWLTDINQLLERNPDLDWERVLESARKREIERMVALCLTLVRDVMGAVLPERVEEWLSTQPHALRLASRLRTGLFWHEKEDALRTRGFNSLLAPIEEEDVDTAPDLGANRLLAQTIDRPTKRLGFYWHIATTPSAKERAQVDLPAGFESVWMVLQPFHALQKRWNKF